MTDQDIEIARLVLDYIKALIWPATVVVLALIFESEFIGLLRRMTKWAGPGFSAEFAERAKEVDREIEGLLINQRPTDQYGEDINAVLRDRGYSEIPGNFDFSRYHAMAQYNPNLALAGIRMDLEVLLRIVAQTHDVVPEKRFSSGSLLRQLTSAEAISASDSHAAQEIISLCNRAVHGEPIRAKDALRVIDAAERLMRLLLDRALTGNPAQVL